MALQFRQGPESDRLSITPAQGEPIWITDQKKLYIGDGSTAGGVAISASGGGSGTYTNIVITASTGTISWTGGPTLTGSTTDLTLDATGALRLQTNDGLIVGDGAGLSRIGVNTIAGVANTGTIMVETTATFNQPILAQSKITVGDGSGDAIITSNGSTALKLRTNDVSPTGTQIQMNQGNIQAQVVEGGYRSLFTLSTGTAQFNSDAYDFEDQLGNVIATFNTGTIFFNTNIHGVTVNQPSTFVGTLTIASVTIGRNNNAITVPNVVSNSNNVLFNAGLNNGVSMFFGLKNTTGVNRSLAFTRNGNIAFFNTASIQTSQAGTGAITIVAGPNTTNGNEGNATIQTSAGLNFISAQYTGPVMGSFSALPVRLQSDGLDVGTFTTGTTKIVAYNSLDGTVASTLTMAYNNLRMTDGTNSQIFEINNTTATINVPVVTTTATVNYSNITNWQVFTAITADPGGTTATGTVLMADGVTWDPAGYSTTTNYIAFYNGTAWTSLG